MLSQAMIKSFQTIILDFYKANGRHHLPWRTSHITPYHIMVSEIMLQQTQVDRVVPKFLSFMTRFPTIQDLANAPQSDVIKLWSGLGYNRRARYLHQAAKVIVGDHKGVVPSSLSELTTLPGLGSYTSSAILAFSFNLPVSVIETNIRTVYIHHFYPNHQQVDDKLLLPLINATINHDNPRQWYAALMDYGAHLKMTVGNLTRQSKTYAKQSKFEGSQPVSYAE